MDMLIKAVRQNSTQDVYIHAKDLILLCYSLEDEGYDEKTLKFLINYLNDYQNKDF